MITKQQLAMALQNRKGSGLHGGAIKDYIDKAKGAVNSAEELYMLIRKVMQLIQQLKQTVQSKQSKPASTAQGSGFTDNLKEIYWTLDELYGLLFVILKVLKEEFIGSGMKSSLPEPKSSSKKQNPWMAHVAQVRKDNPNIPYKDILALAKKSYNKPADVKGSGKCEGAGVGIGTTLAIASAAKAIAPPLERVLKDAGVLNFYSNVSGSIAKKFSQVLSDPSRSREKNIIVNVIPKLVRQYEHLQNIEANKKITEARKRKINFQKAEITSKIKQKLANVRGIREIRELNDLKPAYIEARSQPKEE